MGVNFTLVNRRLDLGNDEGKSLGPRIWSLLRDSTYDAQELPREPKILSVVHHHTKKSEHHSTYHNLRAGSEVLIKVRAT
jgi:hypothetical protein